MQSGARASTRSLRTLGLLAFDVYIDTNNIE